MKYIEFCAGIGGMRAGLDAAGWQCVLALDHDPDAVEVHRLAHGDAVIGDVTLLSSRDIPEAEVWVAGFPCQPFSSSGTRRGFGHVSGNVFEHLVRLAESCKPSMMILENVEGLLTNKSGHTFGTILLQLTRLGYEVDWLVMDLRWFDVPQSRPRLFIVARLAGALESSFIDECPGTLRGITGQMPSIFSSFIGDGRFSWSLRSRGTITDVVGKTQPLVGKPQHTGPRLFGSFGHAKGERFASFDITGSFRPPEPSSLAQIVAPKFLYPEFIRSARYWSPAGGGGAHGLHIRREALSHCVGTSLGGAPLFAVPTKSLRGAADRRAFLQYSNWHREQDEQLVMRLQPERSTLLFGPHTERLSEAVCDWKGSATRKFKLVGNMVAPVCAWSIATIIGQHLPKQRKKILSRDQDRTSTGNSELPIDCV